MNQALATKDAAAGRGDVSVAIAVYNGARYLPALLDSIIAQTVPPAEVVCSDDASTDDSVAILERYAETAPFPVRIIRQDANIGIIENFLAAFRATRGRFIAYCDQDDVWLETKLASCLEAIDDPEVSFVSHASRIVDENLTENGEIYYNIARDLRLRFPAVSFQMHAWGHQMLFSRAALEVLLALYDDEGFRDSELGDCFDYGIPFAASLVGDLCYKKAPHVLFRRHAGATSSAGLDAPAAGRDIRARLNGRAERLAERARRLELALKTIGGPHLGRVRSAPRSAQVHDDMLGLTRRRVRLAMAKRLARRAAQLPGLAVDAVRVGRPLTLQSKELIADMLTVLFGASPGRALAEV